MNIQKSIRKILREYLEEARLSDLLRVTGNKNELHKQIEKEISKEFEIDRELPTQLTLKKRYNNKKIKVYFSYYDNLKHNLKQRIKERTSFKSISEFAEIITDVVNYVLPDELGDNINQNGKYAVKVMEKQLTIIFSVNLNNIKDNQIQINIITVLSKTQIEEHDIIHSFIY